ncbi:MAG TPA: hypothetical protein VG839_04980 [Asticcacaulis sp.]|nr:hypothetical protein [Asticcacaulis sp.]
MTKDSLNPAHVILPAVAAGLLLGAVPGAAHADEIGDAYAALQAAQANTIAAANAVAPAYTAMANAEYAYMDCLQSGPDSFCDNQLWAMFDAENAYDNAVSAEMDAWEAENEAADYYNKLT